MVIHERFKSGLHNADSQTLNVLGTDNAHLQYRNLLIATPANQSHKTHE